MGAPRMEISATAWASTVAELERVAPREGVVVPLVALEYLPGRSLPWTVKHLDDLAAVRIAEVVLLPPSLQHNSAVTVAALAGADAWVDQAVRQAVERMPRLRAAAFLHSHPFAHGTTFPSMTDCQGHMRPQLQHNQACLLDASFSFIACRREHGRGWVLWAFALEGQGQRVVNLGQVVAVADDSPGMLHARHPALHASRGRFAVRRFVHRLRRQGWRVQRDELFDGWTRIRADVDRRHSAVALVPPELHPMVSAVVDLASRRTSVLDARFDDRGSGFVEAVRQATAGGTP